MNRKILNLTKKPFSSTVNHQQIIKDCKEHTLFSWSAQNKISPMNMTHSEGVYFWADGKKYFDMNSQLMCSNLGHQNKYIINAIKKQADELCFAGPSFATEVRAKASKLLTDLTPGDLKKVFYTLGGAEANENAIKFAKFYTKRHKLIARYRSYHGATQGAISLTGDPRRWSNEPSLPGVIRTWDPYKYRCLFYKEGMSDEEYSDLLVRILEEQIMFENPESIAGIFLETVTGTNGLIIPPKGYLKGIRRICDKYGIVMICDEVMAGFGRTGKVFAVDNWNVVPDIITTAKGLTSAYLPLGACIVSNKIAKEFEERPFQGGLTYQSHPMCLAASIASIEYLKNEKVIENVNKIGEFLSKRMREMKEKHSSLGDVRSIGLFGVFELVKSKKTKEPLCGFNQTSEAMQKLSGYLKENGIFHYTYLNMLHCHPPLVVKEDELRDALNVVDKALEITDQYTI